MSVFQGDFLGFSLGKEHSYNINITRISSNDRYQDILLPNFTDSTVQVPGGDGTYYFDTYYTQKPITIDFAFDELYDEDLRKLRQMFSIKGIQPLIFDEFPYKQYMVKCVQPPQLKYLCFDYQERRIYKGEGSVQFVAYYPFAFGVVTPNVNYNLNGGIINNIGDLPANLIIVYNLQTINGIVNLELKDEKKQVTIGQLNLRDITPFAGDVYIQINTQTQLIEGLNASKQKTGHLYNRYITKGDFFYPPVGRTYLFSSKPFVSANYTQLYY